MQTNNFEQNTQKHQPTDSVNHPLASEAASCWSPENAKAFSPAQNNNSERSYAGNDAALNAFFAQAIGDGAYASQPNNRQTPEFSIGAQAQDKSIGNFNDVKKAMNINNVDGVVRDVNKAIQNADGTIALKDVGATRGQTAAKEGIKDGVNKVGNAKVEMHSALESLKDGEFSKAHDLMQKALDIMNNGKKEIEYGVKDVETYKPTASDSDSKPESKSENKSAKPAYSTENVRQRQGRAA